MWVSQPARSATRLQPWQPSQHQSPRARKNQHYTATRCRDDAEVRELLFFTLSNVGYGVIEAESAEEALQLLDERLPDLILIDWTLPGMSGVELAKYVRKDNLLKDLPMMMLTARDAEGDKLKSFDFGIDDYLTKPFSPKELVARIKALLRRNGTPDDNILKFAGISMDLANHRVFLAGDLVHLKPTEFRILALLIRHPERTFDREQLLDRVWGRSVYIDERTVDVYMLRVRKRLKPYGLDKLLKTVRGIGYRFSAE
ncbi:UNVERIFIED_CONTAM: hypothetical protein GTU68_053788 [Idotea baltica]|nr:hypothetical protein [Idotea baltica]